MSSFNVAFEPWIPVRVRGHLELYSLEQTLLQAQEIERLEDASPLVTVAVHRLLLAVLHRALDGPLDTEECADWLVEGAFPRKAVQTYLRTWSERGRFDLFDAERPFYQTPAFISKAKSVAQLAAELASGTNKLLFDHTHEDDPPALSPAIAVRLLLARQMLAIPEGAGYSPSPIGGAAVVVPQGTNLLETLCFNLVPYAAGSDDKPVWEADEGKPDVNQPILGLTHRYTWVSRLIRLEPEVSEEGTKVRFLHYGPACKLKEGAVFNPDPMLAYRVVDEKSGERRAVSFRRDRALWRDFTALLPQSGNLAPSVLNHAAELLSRLGRQEVLQMLVLGATNDKAKFEFWRSERYALPEALSANRTGDVYAVLKEALERAEGLGKTLYAASYTLARKLLSHGERDPDPTDVKRMVSGFPTAAAYWGELDRNFPELLNHLTADFEPLDAQRFWIDRLLGASDRAWTLTRRAAGDDAFALRALYSAEGALLAARKRLRTELKPQEVV